MGSIPAPATNFMTGIMNRVTKCEGNCEVEGGCFGYVSRVHVISKGGHDWGEFNYCMNAIDVDKANGFDIYFVKEEVVVMKFKQK